jgi:DNA-binding MarR family transcriptional regulator
VNFKVAKLLRPADIYFRFLQLTETVRGLPALPLLEPLESRILEFIAYARQNKERLSVKDLMGKRELGSPAMLHGRLKSMREKGWIMLEDTEDARRKQLVLRKAALTHFDKLSRLMVQAIKKSGLV